MHTIDCFRSGSTGELTVICTGMTTAPVAIDLETGTSVTLHPAQVNADLARFGVASVISTPHSSPGDAWWADLPIDKDRTQARLALMIDGVVQNVTARWPEPEPKPKRKRRRNNVVTLAAQGADAPPRGVS
jgi:hypothetical protein